MSTVDNVTGNVTALVVQDDAWQDSPEEVDPAPVDETGLTADQLNGVETLPTPTATPTTKPSPGPTQTAKPIGPTVVGPTAQSATAATADTSFSSAQRAKVVAYAAKYWKQFSTAKYLTSPNDCTNFLSQALFAGGWAKHTGYYTSDSAWWYTGNCPIPKSHTWAGAQAFHNFAVGSGRTSILTSISLDETGDILQYDVDPVGMNHSMVVTYVKDGMPYLTYHSASHYNKPFSVIKAEVLKEDSTPSWYLHRT